MSRTMAAILLGGILAAFGFLHLYGIDPMSITWDEGGDMGIVECIQKSGTPFDCLGDVTQTRLPFLIHAAAGPAWEDEHRAHYFVSLVFSLLTLITITAFAWGVYGPPVAVLTAALYVTSIQLLTAGRMMLTHSNIIFTFFTTLSFVSILLFATGRRRLCLVVCAIASGAAVASHPLGLFNGLSILAIYVVARRFLWRDLLLIPLAAATFFAASVIYVEPENFMALVRGSLKPGAFPHWNHFDTGSPYAPWWFPWLLLIVKIGPWWLVLAALCAFRARLDRSLIAFLGGFALNLIFKGAVFHYETPHHQVQWYPVLLLAIAVAVVKALSGVVQASGLPSVPRPEAGRRPAPHGSHRAVMMAVAICFVVQVADVIRFFPSYLFYGSQYGERFVGEFYGPAVMHAQERTAVNRAIDKILLADGHSRILVADHNILDRNDPRVVPFSKRDPETTYEYAFVDRLHGVHFRFPERDAFNELLAQKYEPHYTYYFPPRMWAYRILRRRY